MFKAEPEAPQRKLLYRRGGTSHILGHTLSYTEHPLLSGPLIKFGKQRTTSQKGDQI